jgi:outer membrane protein
MKTRSLRPVIVAAAICSWWSGAALPAAFGWEIGSGLWRSPSDAQTAPATPHPMPDAMLAGRLSHLTLDDAVELCLHRNPDILRQLQEIQRLQGLVIQVRAAAIPHLVATGTFQQMDKSLINNQTGSGGQISGLPDVESTSLAPVSLNNIFNQLLGSSGGLFGNESEPDKNYTVTIEVTQTLYNAAIPPQIRQARFQRNAAYYALRETVDTAVNTVKTDFYAVLLNQALITINEQNLRLLESQLQDQQNRFQAGTVPRFDVLQASVAVANQRPAVIAANNNYSLSYIGLARVIGIEYGPDQQKNTPIKLIGNLDYHPQEFSNEEGVRSAKAERGLLKEQRLNILSQVEGIRVAAAGYQPTLTASGGGEQRNDPLSQDFYNEQRGWFWGANFNWNIFDGLATYGLVKQQRALLAEAKATYDDSVRQVVEEVQINYDNLQQYKQTIQSQVLNVSEAEEAVRLSQARLSAGAGTQLDVLTSQVALLQAQTTELQARYNYAVTLGNYERVTATSTVYPETFDDPLARQRNATGRVSNPTGVAEPGKRLAPSTIKTPDTQRVGKGVPQGRRINVDKPDMPVHPHSVAKPDEPPLKIDNP